ncbi:MAG: insulinase family protein [Gammaproteobacteria bacterium]|nr:insulinase family protein [Gammaproteobacteria bacterium]
MRLFRLVPLFFAAVALAACTISQSPQTTAPASNARGIESGKVVRATLDNGLKVVIVPNDLAPVVTQQITYMVGGNQAPEGFPGIAHAQEHMMFRGAPGLNGNQLAGVIARMGGAMNAFTTNNITSYFFIVPKGDVGVALHVGAIRMAGVTDSAEAWNKERGAIEQEVARDQSTAFRQLIMKTRAALFAGTPYARSALGTSKSFDKLTAGQLKKFHDAWYAPNNALMVIAGNVDPQAVLAKVKKLYGDIPAQQIPEKSGMTFAPVAATTLSAPSDLPVGIIGIAFRMPGYESPNYPAAELASRVLSSKRGPIASLKYQGKALATGFQMLTMPDVGMGFAYAVYPSTGNADEVRQALVHAIQEVRKDGIAADLVKAAKRRAVLAGELRKNSISGLAMAWTSAIALADLDSPDEAIARLREVTPAQVNAQVRKQLDLDHAITLIAKPTPGSKPHMGAGFGGPESFSAKPKGPVTLPDWAQQAFATLPHPKPFLHPVDMKLDNGLRLIVLPLNISDSVSLFGSVHQNSDLQAPKGKKGIASLLATLFEWGPEGMGRLTFDAAQDEIGAQLSLGQDFSLKVLPQYFDQGVALLAKAMLNPALPKKAFKKMQFMQARQAAGRVNSPKFKFRIAVLKALLPEGDPKLRIATVESIGSLTLKDLKAYYRKVYQPDVATIVVAGDITPARAKAVVKKYFGDWHAFGPTPNLNYPPIPLSEKARVFVPDELKKQNQVVLAETLHINYTNPDHFALDLANTYLSGGFYATPLYRVLRANLGLVYNVGSSFDFERNRGTFKLHYGSYPQKVDEARKAALDVLEKVMKKPLTDKQMHLAKSMALRGIQLSKRSVSGIGWGWINRVQDGLPLDWSYVMARHFEKLTAPEIHAALNKYFNPDRLSTIVLGQPVE